MNTSGLRSNQDGENTGGSLPAEVRSAIKERPILFSAPMVRAILEGRKTQTRRVVKPQPYRETIERSTGYWNEFWEPRKELCFEIEDDRIFEFCPYGVPGDRLWAITIVPISEYEDRYGVGDDGNVYRTDGPEPKRLRSSLTSKGYPCVTLCRGGAKHTALVHQLVFNAFYGFQESHGEVRHLDSDKTNNRPENLDWATGSQNWTDRRALGNGIHAKHHSAKLTQAIADEIRASSKPTRQWARELGVSQPTIQDIRSGKTWVSSAPPPAEPNLPRWASRILLEITDVRVQRVQEISPEDVIDEGLDESDFWDEASNSSGRFLRDDEPISAFRELWDSINSKRGFGWDANPWVWAISFRRIQ